MNDPATLIDCFNCEATNWPDDQFCHNCKIELWDEERKKKEADMKKYFDEEYKRFQTEKPFRPILSK